MISINTHWYSIFRQILPDIASSFKIKRRFKMFLRVRHELAVCVCVLSSWMLLLSGMVDIHAGNLPADTGRKDSLTIYFEISSGKADPALAGNGRKTDSLKRIILRYGDLPGFRMSMTGYASPDGTVRYNDWLSARRVEDVRRQLEDLTGEKFPDSAVDTVSVGVDWEGLAKLIAGGLTFKGSDEVLSIVTGMPLYVIEDGKITGGRKKSLMDLHRGDVFRYMMDHVFPELRRVGVTVYYTVPEPLPVLPSVKGPGPVIQQAGHPLLQIGIKSRPVQESYGKPQPEKGPAGASDVGNYRLALKTNFLSDIILMPSLEAEYLINDKWTVAAHGAVAWWSNGSAHKYYQLATIYPEARWWFRTRGPWHGHYLGAFAGGSWYDLENGGRGYKGEGGFVGLSYGYMFPVGKRLSIEAGIGAGYLYTKYEEYLPVPYMGGTHYVYQQTSQMHWLGPLKFKLALVWRLWNDRKGGAR